MIEIYGKTNCVFCDRAKTLVESKGLEYSYKELGVDYTLEDFMNLFPGRKSVPQILVDGRLLDNGYTSLEGEL